MLARWSVRRLSVCVHFLTLFQDRRLLSMNDLHAPLPPMEATQVPFREPEETNYLDGGSSTKIDQLIELLNLTPHTEKSLVFSQFTR